MSHPPQSGPLNLVLLLLDQARSYTNQLVQAHLQLGVLYRELAHLDHELEPREGKKISRKTKKHLQWRRALHRTEIKRMEVQQEFLEEYLKQCGTLAASLGTPIPGSSTTPVSPWTSSMSFADLNVPFSPPPQTPWTAGPFEERRSTMGYAATPQYWDLSMLRESHDSRPPHRSLSAADSGFHEPLIPGDVSEGIDDPAHVWAHERMAQVPPMPTTIVRSESKRSSLSSGRDEVLDLPTMSTTSSTREGAVEETRKEHRRRHSDLIVCRSESYLSSPAVLKRAVSVGPSASEEEETA